MFGCRKNVGAVVICQHYILGLARFFHVPSVYRTAFHVPLRYIERYFMYSIVYWKAPSVWLCIRKHYYQFELPGTLCISRDPTMIPYPSEKIHLAIFLGAIHWKQHSGRLLRTYSQGISRVAPSWQSRWETWLSELLLSFKFAFLAYSLSREIFGVFYSFGTLG